MDFFGNFFDNRFYLFRFGGSWFFDGRFFNSGLFFGLFGSYFFILLLYHLLQFGFGCVYLFLRGL